jgi:hypothetical protein
MKLLLEGMGCIFLVTLAAFMTCAAAALYGPYGWEDDDD